MRMIASGGLLLRSIRTFGIMFALYLVFSMATGLLLWLSPVPESAGKWILTGLLCVCCFFLATGIGAFAGRGGLLLGLLAAAVFILAAMGSAVMIAETPVGGGFLQWRWIPCLAAGMIGGVNGVNRAL